MVSANDATFEPRCNKKSNRSQDALLEGPQIFQISRQTNSFQNMDGVLKAKIDHLARKSLILVDTNLGYLTLEGPGRQTVDN